MEASREARRPDDIALTGDLMRVILIACFGSLLLNISSDGR